jgi:hypothetical protein
MVSGCSWILVAFWKQDVYSCSYKQEEITRREADNHVCSSQSLLLHVSVCWPGFIESNQFWFCHVLVICGLFALTSVATPYSSNVAYPFYLEEQVSGEQYSHSQKTSCSWCWTLFNLAVFGHGEFGLCLWDDWDHHLVSACNGFVFCCDCQEEVLAVSGPIQELWQAVPCFWFRIIPSYTKCWCSHVSHPLS